MKLKLHCTSLAVVLYFYAIQKCVDILGIKCHRYVNDLLIFYLCCEAMEGQRVFDHT